MKKKITTSYLRRLIKEEIEQAEGEGDRWPYGTPSFYNLSADADSAVSAVWRVIDMMRNPVERRNFSFAEVSPGGPGSGRRYTKKSMPYELLLDKKAFGYAGSRGAIILYDVAPDHGKYRPELKGKSLMGDEILKDPEFLKALMKGLEKYPSVELQSGRRTGGRYEMVNESKTRRGKNNKITTSYLKRIIKEELEALSVNESFTWFPDFEKKNNSPDHVELIKKWLADGGGTQILNAILKDKEEGTQSEVLYYALGNGKRHTSHPPDKIIAAYDKLISDLRKVQNNPDVMYNLISWMSREKFRAMQTDPMTFVVDVAGSKIVNPLLQKNNLTIKGVLDKKKI